MSGLTRSQRKIAAELFSLPPSDGFLLAGGAALCALAIVDRPTRDLDAFVAARPTGEQADVRPLMDAFIERAGDLGWAVDVARVHPTFTRLVVHAEGEVIELDLAVDSPPMFDAMLVDGIPMLAPEDLAARKVLAVVDRAEGRDFTDLWSLARRFGRTECVRWATDLDAGVSVTAIAQGMTNLNRLTEDDLPCVPDETVAVREYFAAWVAELGEEDDDG